MIKVPRLYFVSRRLHVATLHILAALVTKAKEDFVGCQCTGRHELGRPGLLLTCFGPPSLLDDLAVDLLQPGIVVSIAPSALHQCTNHLVDQIASLIHRALTAVRI